MTRAGEPTVKDAGNQTARNPSEELGRGEELGPGEELGRGEELGPGEKLGPGTEHEARGGRDPGGETAEQRRQRRLQRELALRVLI